MDIGGNIRRLREEAGMTQEELAEALGKTRGAVTQWEIGWSAPRFDTLDAMAALFDVPISAIVDVTPAIADNSEVRLLECYRKMNPEGRRTLLNTAESLALAFPPEPCGVPEGRRAG